MTAYYSKHRTSVMAGFLTVLVLAALYYGLFLRDDRGGAQSAPKQAQAETAAAIQTQLFAVTDANIRDKATTVDSTVLGRLSRGQTATGVLISEGDTDRQWLQLDEGKGFIAVSNLSENEPPKLIKLLGDKIWTTDKAITIYTEPTTEAAPIETVKARTALSLYGLTTNDFIEIKLKKNGVGYIAGGARIVALSLVKGRPVTFNFNPASCDFGGELESEFAKLTAKSRAAYKAIDMTDFASDAARDKALIGFEGKSYFQRLERSFNGLSITGIAQHYESQSMYFADAPDKVLAAFKAAGYKIGRDGQFTNTEIYAGIGATGGEGRSFGKSDLSCGV